MPRYFFHICDQYGTIIDDEGMGLPDDAAVKREGEASAQDLPRGTSGVKRRIEVTDRSGRSVATFITRPSIH